MENKNESLYDIFKKYSYSQLQKLFKEAKTKEEQDLSVHPHSIQESLFPYRW